jgi:hypothetical protein
LIGSKYGAGSVVRQSRTEVLIILKKLLAGLGFYEMRIELPSGDCKRRRSPYSQLSYQSKDS